MDEVKEINDGSDLELVPVNQSSSANNNSKQIVPEGSFQEYVLLYFVFFYLFYLCLTFLQVVEKVLAGAIR